MTAKFLKRYVVVGMVFVGYMVFYIIHANVGMAVVAMTSSKNITGPNGTVKVPPEYKWNSMQNAVAVSSFSYGRLFGSMLGVFATRIGGSMSYFLGIVGSAIAVFSMPYLLKVDFWLFVVGNMLTGIFEGISYTSVPQIWSRWAPPNERAKMISMSLIGIYIGVIASFLIAGWILLKWNWEILFYATGITTFAWAFIWLIVVKNDPADDKWISDAERKFIKEQLKTKTADEEELAYPYRDILTSTQFWLVCLGKFTIGFGVTFMIMYLPQYIKDTNDVNIQIIGLISMVPQVVGIMANLPAGYIFDYLRSNKILSLSNIHKLYSCVGFFAAAISFLAIGLGSNFIISIICMLVFQILIPCAVLQNIVALQDLASRYASFMGSVAMFCYNIASILTPLIFGSIVTSHSRLQWNICFVIFAAIFISTALVHVKFQSVKVQYWANYSAVKKPDEPQESKSLM